MADIVNPQITDSVTQANVKVLGDAPAQALASLYQVMAHSIGLAMQNAVANQQNMAVLANAATARAVQMLCASSGALAHAHDGAPADTLDTLAQSAGAAGKGPD